MSVRIAKLTDGDAILTIGMPTYIEEMGYRCDCTLSFPGFSRTSEIYGRDSGLSLILALHHMVKFYAPLLFADENRTVDPDYMIVWKQMQRAFDSIAVHGLPLEEG